MTCIISSHFTLSLRGVSKCVSQVDGYWHVRNFCECSDPGWIVVPRPDRNQAEQSLDDHTHMFGGLEHLDCFSIILGMSSSQLTFIFFRRVGLPPTSIDRWIHTSSLDTGRSLANLWVFCTCLALWGGHRTCECWTRTNKASPFLNNSRAMHRIAQIIPRIRVWSIIDRYWSIRSNRIIEDINKNNTQQEYTQ